MICAFNRLRRDERGTTAVEYTIIAALIALAIVGGLSAIGTKLASKYAPVSNALS